MLAESDSGYHCMFSNCRMGSIEYRAKGRLTAHMELYYEQRGSECMLCGIWTWGGVGRGGEGMWEEVSFLKRVAMWVQIILWVKWGWVTGQVHAVW